MGQAKISFEVEAKVLANTKELENSLGKIKKSLQEDFSGSQNKKALGLIDEIIKARDRLEKIYSLPITSPKDADSIEKYTQQIVRGFLNLGLTIEELRGKPLSWGDILKDENKGKSIENAIDQLEKLIDAESNYADKKKEINEKIKKSSGSGLSAEQQERKKLLEQQKKNIGASKKVLLLELKDVETYLEKLKALEEKSKKAVSSGKFSTQKEFLQKRTSSGGAATVGNIGKNGFQFQNKEITFENGTDLLCEINKAEVLKQVLIELDLILPEIPIDTKGLNNAQKELERLDDSLEKQRENLPQIKLLLLNTFKIDTSEMNAEEVLETFNLIKRSVENTRFNELNSEIPEADRLIKLLGNDGKLAFLEIGTEAEKALQKMDFKNRLAYFFGFDNVIRLFKQGIREAYLTVSELDKSITEMAVVTDMSVSEIWGNLDDYTKKANELGVTTNDAINASTLYYQLGLKTAEVNALVTSTLKMARIAGLDSATATDRMTNALRGFNMELNETSAERVADVYSKLAAVSATDVNELSVAMTKTASIAASANMSFENTAAYLAQMLETTRESAETAGTALKTVIGRFTEVKELYSKGQLEGTDDEGEAIDVNKVSAALRTAGIDMNKFFTGEVGLDEIFNELAEKWDSLSIVLQRYIATLAAGSRQLSRFIAMLGDYDRLLELQNDAYNANGASAEQFEKTQESLESKVNRLKNAWNEFLMGLANNKAIKGVVDLGTKLLTILNKMTKGTNDLTSTILKLGATLGAVKFGNFLIGKNDKLSGITKGITEALKKVSSKNIFDAGIDISLSIGSGIKSGLEKSKKITDGLSSIPKKFALSFERENQQIDQFMNMTSEAFINENAAKKYQDYLENVADESTDVFELQMAQIAAQEAAQVEAEEVHLALSLENMTLEEVKAESAEFNTGQILLVKILEALGYDAATATEIVATEDFTAALKKLGIQALKTAAKVLLPLLAVAAVIASLVLLFKGIYEIIHLDEIALEGLQDTATKAADAAELAAEAYNDILDKSTQLHSLNAELNSLVVGTEEWYAKQEEVNDAVKELLELYPDLEYTIDENGTWVVSTASLAEAQATAENRKHMANATEYLAQARVYDLQAKMVEGADESFNGWNYSELTDEQKFWMQNLENAPDSIKESLGITEDLSDETYQNAKNWALANEQVDQYNKKATLARKNAIIEAAASKGITLDQRTALVVAENSTSRFGVDAKGRAGTTREFSGTDAALTGGLALGGAALGATVGAAALSVVPVVGTIIGAAAGAAIGLAAGAIADAVLASKTEEVWKNGSDSTTDALKESLEYNGIASTGSETEDLKAYAQNVLGMDPSEWEDMKDSEIDDFLGPIVTEAIEALEEIQTLIEMPQLLQNFDLNFQVNIEDLSNDTEKQIYQKIEEAREEALKYVEDKGLSINLFAGEDGEIDYNAADQYKTLMEAYEPLLSAFTALASTGTWSENSDAISGIHFESAILGFADLNEQMKKGTPEMQAFAASCLAVGGSLYGVNALAKEFVGTLEASDLAELDSAEAVLELAKSNKTLATMLDNTGVSASAYAEYFLKVADGTIDAETATEGYLVALAKLHAALNTITDSLAWINNFDAGESSTTIGSSIAEWVETINELYEKGAYGDKLLQNYIKAIIGEDEWERVLQKADGNLKTAIESVLGRINNFGDSFYNAWVSFAAKSESATVLADGSILLDFSKFADTEDLISLLELTLGVSKDIATAMVAEIVTYSEDLTDAFKHSDMENSIDAWLNGAVKSINGGKYLLDTDLKELAKLLDTDVATIEANLSDGILVIKTGDGLTDLIKDLLDFDEIKNNSFVDLDEKYELLIEAGFDDTTARNMLTLLVKDANNKFSDLSFGWDDAKFEKAANETQEEYEKRISNGIAMGVSSNRVTNAQETSAIKARVLYTKHIMIGIRDAFKAIAGNLDGKYKKFFNNISNAISDEAIEEATTISEEELETLDRDKDYNNNITKWKTTLNLSNNVNNTSDKDYGSGYTTPGSKTTKDDEDESDWENDREWLHNLLEEIEANTRLMTLLEADMKDMQEDAASYNVKDVTTNIEETMLAFAEKIAAATVERDAAKARIDAWLKENPWALGLISYDSKGYINEDYAAIEALKSTDPTKGEALDELLGKIEPYLGYYNSALETLEGTDDEVRAFKKKITDVVIQFKNRVVEALKDYYLKQIDEQKAVADAIEESNNNLINSISEAIDKLRQEEDNADTVQDIEDKQQRLAYLKLDTSGANQMEILLLQKEIDEALKDYTDTLIDLKINELKDQNEKSNEQRQEQIDLALDLLDWAEKTGELTRLMEKMIAEDIDPDTGKIADGSMLMTVLTGRDGWKSMSKEELDAWADEVNSLTLLTASYTKYMELHLKLDTGFKVNDSAVATAIANLNTKISNVMTGVTNKLLELEKKIDNINTGNTPTDDPDETPTALYSKGLTVKWVNGIAGGNRTGTGTITNVDTSGSEPVYTIKDNTGKEFNITESKLNNTSGVSVGGVSVTPTNTNEATYEKTSGKDFTANLEKTLKDCNIYLNSKGESSPSGGVQFDTYTRSELHGSGEVTWKKSSNKLTIGETANWTIKSAENPYVLLESNKNSKNPGVKVWVRADSFYKKTYKTGGLADFTGPAWLDGTKSKPEMVLNSTDTENFIMLKDILSSLLKNGTSTKSNTSEMINTFNIYVDEIADDYDVDKIVDRVKKDLYEIGSYRNVTQINRLR